MVNGQRPGSVLGATHPARVSQVREPDRVVGVVVGEEDAVEGSWMEASLS